MTMESPVRICLGAALVVNLLLISATTVGGNALPLETTATTVRDDRNSRFNRVNSTAWTRSKPKIPDVALNELHPKETTSEENTEKNAKYKDRGRIRFQTQPKSSTESTLRRVTSPTEIKNVMIVTPTPEVKKPAEIIDSMRNYKKTKMPIVSTSTAASKSIKNEFENEEEYVDDEEEDDKESFEKFTSSKFHDSNFFTIPTFSYEDDFNTMGEKHGSKKQNQKDYSPPSFSFSSFFPKEGDNSGENSYKSESFFDFDSDLTTPKNDFFDKKFQEISSSIMKNLASVKTKSQATNDSTPTVIKENVDVAKLSNGTPTNKSTVIIKNTKEVRLLDNDPAGTANKELSDIHGTSIYYEMSVLSTETYNINHSNDDDCDNDTSAEATLSTPSKEDIPLIATQPTIAEVAPTKQTLPDTIPRSTNLLSANIIPTAFSSVIPLSVSTQNIISSTEKTTKVFSSSYTRNRSYSKRLNLTGTKDSPNSVTILDQPSPNQNIRSQTRRFHHTTPKIKPIWMAPRKNFTRTTYTRSTVPTTIYSEYFNIKDKFTTMKPVQPKAVLTTVSSDIDPVLQEDTGGQKKVVQSQSLSDNTIPSLWKRGSTKFSTSTATSTEVELGVSDLEIPPTLTAWALASLRSPPSFASPMVNVTGSTQKSVDENDLQKVGEVVDKKEITTRSPAPAPTTIVNENFISKNVTEIYQNKLPWRPMFSSTQPTPDKKENFDKISDSNLETLAAASNLSVQSSPPASTNEMMNVIASEATTVIQTTSKKEVKPSWVPVTANKMTTEEIKATSETEPIPPVDATKSTGFESITKLPSGLTTPKDEVVASSEEKNEIFFKSTTKIPATTDYEITTIRFSYVPTEAVDVSTDTEDTTIWHALDVTKTKTTTIVDEPITTYRPKYITTTDMPEETTTVIIDTTPQIEVSSQVTENEIKKEDNIIDLTTTDMTTDSTVESTKEQTTEQSVTEIMSTVVTTESYETMPETAMPETMAPTEPIEPNEGTTIIIEVKTEINTEKERTVTPTAQPETTFRTETSIEFETQSISEENSDSNEVISQNTKPTTQPTMKVETTTQAIDTTSEVQTEPTTEQNEHIVETTVYRDEMTTDVTTKSVSELEDLTSYSGEVTTEASSRVLPDEAGSGAAVAIAVSTIGVIALVLLVGLLLVVRRRGRRGIYAQRCTPVSLDAYSLDSVSVGHRKGNHRLRASKRSYGNPAYDDEVTSHPMQYAALANFAMDIDSMTAEFSEIPSVTVRPDEVPPGCEDKNRYSNVLPLPETRVPLRRIGNDPTTEYINANYITGPGNIRNYYIACQAPLSNTVADFWRMIWEQNSRLVVMLTEYMENGVEKCYEYLPPSEISDNKRTFGDFQIILKKREQRDKYAISSIQLINLGTRTWREVTHLWYFWPAKGVPDDYDSVIDFLCEMRSYMKISQIAKEYDDEGVEVIYGDQNRSSFNNLSKLRCDDNTSGNGVNVYSPAKAEEMMRRNTTTNGTLGRMKAASEVEGVRPCVVVCASGAGRGAAVIAADICARALAAGAADVPRVVRDLRAQRPHALANRHHYIFLYKVLSEYGNKLMGGGVDTI